MTVCLYRVITLARTQNENTVTTVIDIVNEPSFSQIQNLACVSMLYNAVEYRVV